MEKQTRGMSKSRLDWELLRSGPIALFHKQNVLKDAIEWLREQGYSVAEVDCHSCCSEAAILRVILQSIGISVMEPTYQGFVDYLYHHEIADEGGFAFVLRGFEQFASADQEAAEAVLHAISLAAYGKLLFGKRFITLLQSDDPRISFNPIGGQSPVWNRREWSDASREV